MIKFIKLRYSPVYLVAYKVSGLAVYLVESALQLYTTGCGGSWICSAQSEADSTRMGWAWICIKILIFNVAALKGTALLAKLRQEL